MEFFNELKQISKESNISLEEIIKEFNKNNKEIYKRQYGIFLTQITYQAIDLTRDKYKHL